MTSVTTRIRTLLVCAALVISLVVVALLAPLPFAVLVPGPTADVLGAQRGTPVIAVEGARTRETTGELRLATVVSVTPPDASVKSSEVVGAWFDEHRAVVPRDGVYPAGKSIEQIAQHNVQEMNDSQEAAAAAALRHLGLSPKKVRVRLTLPDVGGPSAGLMFALGIIDKIEGDGRGGDLTGGRTIGGTGTIAADGTVGAVGGIELKEQAVRRDGVRNFLIPRSQCATALTARPEGLRLIPVRTLDDALDALKALRGAGGTVPSC
ncbi:hypothetical protein TU94_30660 [Streptomyces cyaneogriseus subsp. noncyanogenus]|uniref:Lon proteolytic domain-containing protein n=1 Tax=Streptomyces cyaneogriseus subsp. noncyanogenus TaxID=477245 RepID=A0A0C5GKX2_9ACTN|nr:S16 family serine protease [Streptomyces cyaneogriseus]AJP05141.1 hypothetical protein TU94_30660 [Streptomyces cyaneogriseus subsp. noncyanogenus]